MAGSKGGRKARGKRSEPSDLELVAALRAAIEEGPRRAVQLACDHAERVDELMARYVPCVYRRVSRPRWGRGFKITGYSESDELDVNECRPFALLNRPWLRNATTWDNDASLKGACLSALDDIEDAIGKRDRPPAGVRPTAHAPQPNRTVLDVLGAPGSEGARTCDIIQKLRKIGSATTIKERLREQAQEGWATTVARGRWVRTTRAEEERALRRVAAAEPE